MNSSNEALPAGGPRTGQGGTGRFSARSHSGSRSLLSGDRVFFVIVLLLAVAVLAIAGIMFLVLGEGAWDAIGAYGSSFIWATEWDVYRGEFGAAPFIVGTLLTSFGALLLAVPLALAAALFVTEYAPRWLAEPVSYLVELLAAIPSVVYGLWGIFVLVPAVRALQIWLMQTPGLGQLPFLRSAPSGLGLFTAIIILTVMIVPFTASVARDVIRLVPRDQREAAYALGGTKWEVIRSAVLPYARAGIFGGVILSLGRALGETMAVTMVIGNRVDFPSGLFASTATMASIIANEFAEALGAMHVSALMYVGLLLFILSIIVNYLARLLIRRLSPQHGGAR